MNEIVLGARSETKEEILDGLERAALSCFVWSVNDVQARTRPKIQDLVREMSVPLEVEGD
jgi:hypothetical protein